MFIRARGRARARAIQPSVAYGRRADDTRPLCQVHPPAAIIKFTLEWAMPKTERFAKVLHSCMIQIYRCSLTRFWRDKQLKKGYIGYFLVASCMASFAINIVISPCAHSIFKLFMLLFLSWQRLPCNAIKKLFHQYFIHSFIFTI